ncbi:MAG: HypC/HybG/HupF family hydrogenase formation chaperone [Armatimonadetes bacterium]|nr:HypC/HybG/HupF family hydrogenase formation chaperone [Armatimonadota bacterium]
MCVAVPSKIVEIEDQTATVEVTGTRFHARLDVLPEAKVGDYVLVHAGFAITIVDEEEARETLEVMKGAGLI